VYLIWLWLKEWRSRPEEKWLKALRLKVFQPLVDLLWRLHFRSTAIETQITA
jgi:hypothetical protein